MTTWVLFLYVASGPLAVWNYASESECHKDADKYKRYACVKVVVPPSTRSAK